MLVVKTFTGMCNLCNSEGKIIKEIERKEYAAIYDDAIINDADVEGCIKNSNDSSDGIVILPLETWVKLHAMIRKEFSERKRNRP